MTNQEIDKIIHEELHGPVEYKEIIRHWCRRPLPVRWYFRRGGGKYKRVPLYTSLWADYGLMLEQAIEEEWWENFEEKLFNNYNYHEAMQILLNPLRGSTTIAEFLKECNHARFI